MIVGSSNRWEQFVFPAFSGPYHCAVCVELSYLSARGLFAVGFHKPTCQNIVSYFSMAVVDCCCIAGRLFIGGLNLVHFSCLFPTS